MAEATNTAHHNAPIPPGVAAQAARAEELMRLQREGPREEGQDQDQQGQEGQGDQGQPQDQQPQPRAQEPQRDAGEPAHDDWEERYKRENGRARQLAGEVRSLGEEVAQLRRLLSTMQQAPAEPKPSPQVVATAQQLISEEERRDYGDDFLGVVGKKAQEVIGPILAKYEAKIAHLEKQLEGVNGAVQETAQDRFFNKLSQLVPTWQELDTNQDFIDWLAKSDPYSGRPRQDMLNEHYSRNDAARVAAFFQGFLDETAAVTAPRGGQPSPGGRASVPAKAPLEQFAAPGRAKSASAPANAGAEDKPTITRAQIAKFYADVNAGKFRGKDAEQKAFEKQIFEASSEGRIV